jgi:profilin
MSWQQYVDDGLVGTGKVASAAIFGQDTATWAQSAAFPGMNPEQVRALLTGFGDPSGLRANGIRVGGDKVHPPFEQSHDMSLFSTSL